MKDFSNEDRKFLHIVSDIICIGLLFFGILGAVLVKSGIDEAIIGPMPFMIFITGVGMGLFPTLVADIIRLLRK